MVGREGGRECVGGFGERGGRMKREKALSRGKVTGVGGEEREKKDENRQET